VLRAVEIHVPFVVDSPVDPGGNNPGDVDTNPASVLFPTPDSPKNTDEVIFPSHGGSFHLRRNPFYMRKT